MDKISVTIAAGASLSGASTLLPAGLSLLGIETDAAWDTNVVSFQKLGDDGSTWKNINSEDALGEFATGPVVASTYTPLSLATFYGCKSLKVRSGTSASPANQVDATVVTLVFGKI